jgi:hypothetical protein
MVKSRVFPSQHRHADSPPRSRNQAAIVSLSLAVTGRGEKAAAPASQEPSFLNGDDTVRCALGDAWPRHGPCDGVEQWPAEPPRSRLHARVRAASSRVAEQRTLNNLLHSFPGAA